jgi:DNA polymerase III sliding clamp (beta) subunit (PCNA family)
MRYSKGEYNLPITSDSIELAPIHYTTHWQISGATLHRLIKEASIASGTTVYRGIYLHYDTQNRCIAAVATDGVRMSCSRHYCEVSEASVMLGKEVCNVLSKWTEGAEVIICFANITDPIEIKWESADVFYQLRVNSIQSKFPNYLNTLNSISSAQRIKVRGQDLTAAINRNSLFSNDQLSKVVLEPGGDKLVIKSSSINLGSGHEIVAAQCVGSASWCVDAKVITDVANTDQEILIRGEASGPIQVCIKDEWIYVFMPILQSRL